MGAAVADRLSQLSLDAAHSGARGDGGGSATGFQVGFVFKSRNKNAFQ